MKSRSIGITVAMLCFLLQIGIVNNSEAASITYISISPSTDYGSGGSVYAYLSADEGIEFIDWYAKQTYPISDADSEYEQLTTSSHYGETNVYVDLGSLSGNIKIAKYDIKAVAWFSDEENNTFISDTSTDTAYIYKPVVDSGSKTNGIYGYSELTAHYFDGSSIVMDGYVYAYNETGNNARGFGRFRHTAQNKPLDELEKDLPSKHFLSSYSYSTSDWGSYFNFDTGGNLQEGEEWVCDAYLRLRVTFGDTDDWWATDANTFDESDNP